MSGSALVTDGGIIGIQISMNLTELGFKIYLVERELAFHLSSVKQKNNKYPLFSKLSVRSIRFILNWIIY